VYGGTGNLGTVFSLAVGLAPFVALPSAAGEVGSKVAILGTNLTGATGVTFNGTSATFRVVSASEISATVPTGASSGPVQVLTPAGTLTSAVAYGVEPKTAEPTFSPRAGSYATAQVVKIADASAGAAIFYTTDGSTPTTASTPYTGPVTVASSETLKALALAPASMPSAVKSGKYTIE
jgi:lipoprotein-anchoring transpeptidase ErfK/SrfK